MVWFNVSFFRFLIWSGLTRWVVFPPLKVLVNLLPFLCRFGLGPGVCYLYTRSRLGDSEVSSFLYLLILKESFFCLRVPPVIAGGRWKFPVILESMPSVVSSFSSICRVASFYPEMVVVFFIKMVSFKASEWPPYSSDWISFLSKADRKPSLPIPLPLNSKEVMPGESGPAAMSVCTLWGSMWNLLFLVLPIFASASLLGLLLRPTPGVNLLYITAESPFKLMGWFCSYYEILCSTGLFPSPVSLEIWPPCVVVVWSLSPYRCDNNGPSTWVVLIGWALIYYSGYPNFSYAYSLILSC